MAGRIAAGEQADRFQLVVAGELPETWLDADKVDQILGNLVENAIRHGAGTVTVVVEPAEIPGVRAVTGPGAPGLSAVAVSVRDEGDGVAPELVPRVFRQFWRAKRRGGAGLGLYIVKGLVEAHGGTITVQRGSRRRRRVPIYHARRRARLRVARRAPARDHPGIPAFTAAVPPAIRYAR